MVGGSVAKWSVIGWSVVSGSVMGGFSKIRKLKYSVSKEIVLFFNNGCNYDDHFIIKELAERLKGKFTCLGENSEKYITFSDPVEKEVTRIDKNRTKSENPYLTDYNLLIAQDLWQAHYQILLIIWLKEFIKLNVKMNMIIKNVKRAELNTNFNTQIS